MKSFVDMAITPKEMKAELAEPMPVMAESDRPRYPYGLCLCLGQHELEKLGISSMPDAGDMIHLMAMAKVTSVSERDTEDGGKDCRVELQITHLALEDEDRETPEAMSERRSKTLYREEKDEE